MSVLKFESGDKAWKPVGNKITIVEITNIKNDPTQNDCKKNNYIYVYKFLDSHSSYEKGTFLARRADSFEDDWKKEDQNF
jgi:hypothetical protein